MQNQDRQTGTVVTWVDNAAFGFAAPHDGGPDLFIHVTQLPSGTDGLRIGQRVSYLAQLDQRTGKQRAVNVEVIDR
ncbi:cold-shock protein [Mesorhizobium huakuii]|uniref:Cold shock domain-containing protein n=1 Tax=Mesorhizobium huakuii TaxID=28104 RepID=A0A7G6SZC0_9HYPH|nr:cold shock domain-containing protein [Mesorhizobium huakuii]QND59852.1 cold shock domain-containing protein [Mesorhizobium huakuii]